MVVENFSQEKIKSIVAAQREYFASGATLSYEFRRKQLKILLLALERWNDRLCDALWSDLHKSPEEALLTEISIVSGEIKNHLSHLKRWMKRECSATPLKMMPSRTYVMSEPLGNALVISPWNYPVQLLLNPLVGAISAGCTALLKPSPYVPNVSATLEALIKECFDEKYVAVVQGNREVNKMLLDERFDIIFFTGSPQLGKEVMQAASRNLTPVILELGGKSPCVVDSSADINIAARRIAWAKTLNAGQTCVAPDYLLIHSSVKQQFVEAFKRELVKLHGEDVKQSRHFVRLVNDRAFKRVSSYLDQGRIVAGGKSDASQRYIEPTLLDDVSPTAPVMQEEIFGPILPMITFDAISEALDFVKKREKPLALYYFGTNSAGREFLHKTSSGGACINDAVMQIANENVPFGGVGTSGMGHYHGRYSFDAFSHKRSVVVTPTWLDLPFRYMPYKMFGLVKKIL
jgi:aldehyde dehydrogenase (NAD+)